MDGWMDCSFFYGMLLVNDQPLPPFKEITGNSRGSKSSEFLKKVIKEFFLLSSLQAKSVFIGS